jgi:N-acetylmuramoyl-L-alanine amidase
MKIAVRFGHQLTGADGGAVGIVKETDVNRRYGPKVISGLQAQGHTVINVTPPEAHRSLGDSLNYGITLANNNNVDLFVSCHVNAATPTDDPRGCEVVCIGSGKGLEYATKISKELSDLGFKNRGAKPDERGLAEIRRTNMPAVIIEPFFMDSATDVAIYNKFGDEGLANAIVKGITGQNTNNTVQVVNNTVASTLVVLQSTTWNGYNMDKAKKVQNLVNGLGIARLDVDGKPGILSLAAFKRLPVAKYSDYHNDAYTDDICQLLGIATPTGYYFNRFVESKVIEFQRAHGLVADGVVGINTLLALLR